MGQNRASVARWQNAQWDIGWKIARWWGRLREAEQGRFVLWLPVCMGIGVLAYYAPRVEPPAWIGVKFAAAGFAAALACGRWPLPRALAQVRGFAALGFASAQYAAMRAPPLETDLPTTAMIVSGAVRAVEITPRGRRITLGEARLEDDGRPRARAPIAPRALVRLVRIRLKAGDETAIETGDTLRVRAMLRPPPPPAWPGAWDLQRDAFHRRLGASGTPWAW